MENRTLKGHNDLAVLELKKCFQGRFVVGPLKLHFTGVRIVMF